MQEENKQEDKQETKYEHKQGLIHLYFGDGKGKTTASIGLAIRAAGTGKHVIFAQFLKGGSTGELVSFEKHANIKVIRAQKDLGFLFQMSEEEKRKAAAINQKVLEEAIEQISIFSADVLILDEITHAFSGQMVEKESIRKFLKNKPKELEVILTGRNPDPFFLEIADYITEMKCVKHPFENGVPAREGIEF